MTVLEAQFLTSAARTADLPDDAAPQVALVGRSNVGKSSLINALVGRRIARTSGTPGKTRLVNLYRVVVSGARRAKPATVYLADLPGYGYAKGGEQARLDFARLTDEYFGDRPAAILLVVDARHPGLAADRDAWRWVRSLGRPAAVVATKIDKLGRADRARALAGIARMLDSPVEAVSAETGEGMDELWKRIAALVNPKAETANPAEPAR